MKESIYTIIDREARKGDGQFAIAYAILCVAESLDRIGSSPDGYTPGAVMHLSNEAKRLADQAERAVNLLSER
jgi:hypothetical protein